MSFCASCGGQLSDGMRFCPFCGSPVTAGAIGSSAGTVTYEPIVTSWDPRKDYRVILVSLGSCGRAAARDLLEDMLGYSVNESIKITANLPIEVATGLNAQQAVTIAQALCEYGMEVSILNGDGVADLDQGSLSARSVFSGDGSFVQSALAILGTLTAANLVRKFVRYDRPSLLSRLFRPRYQPPKPPVHVRRKPRPAPLSTLSRPHRPTNSLWMSQKPAGGRKEGGFGGQRPTPGGQNHGPARGQGPGGGHGPVGPRR